MGRKTGFTGSSCSPLLMRSDGSVLTLCVQPPYPQRSSGDLQRCSTVLDIEISSVVAIDLTLLLTGRATSDHGYQPSTTPVLSRRSVLRLPVRRRSSLVVEPGSSRPPAAQPRGFTRRRSAQRARWRGAVPTVTRPRKPTATMRTAGRMVVYNNNNRPNNN